MGTRRNVTLGLLLIFAQCSRNVAEAASLKLRRSHAEAGLLEGAFPIGPPADVLKVQGCTCGCCVTTYRTPDEIGQDSTVFLKCARDEVLSDGTAANAKKSGNVKSEVKVHEQSCPTTCALQARIDKNKTVPSAATTTGKATTTKNPSKAVPMDYNRFCFYNCRPYDFMVGNICVELDEDLHKITKGQLDPAVHPQVTDPDAQSAWAVSTGKKPPPPRVPTTTTKKLPCHKSDPCAYKLMNASVQEAQRNLAQAKAHAREANRIAASAR
jgi:hypothetical protein